MSDNRQMHKLSADEARAMFQKTTPVQMDDQGNRRPGQPRQSKVARELADLCRDTVAYDEENDTFHISNGHVWEEVNTNKIQAMVQEFLDDHEGFSEGYNLGFVAGLLGLLKGYLKAAPWNDAPFLLPMKNGVLDLKTRELRPYADEDRFSWALPYAFDPEATCEPIQNWLLEVTKGDNVLVQVIRAFFNAVVLGRTSIQRYLEILGPGGTGKSTAMRLAIALVGERNTHMSELKHLENNRFETAELRGKRLLVIADSCRYGGSVDVLKAITGEDPIRYERKHKQQAVPFKARCMVIVAANEPIQSVDYTSGLERRRLTVPFHHQVAPDKRRNLEDEFAPYLPGLLNWVLEMPDEEVIRLLLSPELYSTTLRGFKSEVMQNSNPMAAWVTQHVVHAPGVKTYIGKAVPSASTPGYYESQDTWLYASYVAYCKSANVNPVALQRFGGLLEDLFRNQLKLKDVKKAPRDAKGQSFIGLRLRTGDYDTEPSPFDVSVLVPKLPGVEAVTEETRTSVEDVSSVELFKKNQHEYIKQVEKLTGEDFQTKFSQSPTPSTQPNTTNAFEGSHSNTDPGKLLHNAESSGDEEGQDFV